MSIELQMLTYATILGLVQLLAATHFTTLQRGVKWNMSSREATLPRLTGVAGRLDRAFKNFQETFPIFAALVIITHVTQQSSSLSVWGVQLYLYARILHVIIYAAGITVVRTLVWLISLIGIVLLIAGLV